MSRIRELESILHNIMNYAKVMKVSTIRDSMVHEIVGRCDFTYNQVQVAKLDTKGLCDVGQIILSVCTKYGVRSDEIFGKSRVQKVSRARSIAAYILRENTNMTLKEIGDKLNRNHATVVYLINSVAQDKSLLDDAKKCLKNSPKDMM
jgi:chromosomal replication initiation ATPase DnaA